jgi:hypothetical protein
MAICALGTNVYGQTSADSKPWRLQSSLDLPSNVRLSGESRLRYSSVDGQFRAGGSGGDQLSEIRTLLLGEFDQGPLTFGVELQDSRSYFGDDGTPYAGSIVNPLDVLQAYVRVKLPAAEGKASVQVGRFSLEIGSERVVERTDFGNALQNFTGVYFRGDAKSGDELHAIYVVPLTVNPRDRASLQDNDLSGDEEEWKRRFWGLHYRKANFFGPDVKGVWAEAFVYGFDEGDSRLLQTPDRHYIQPGVRLFRSPAAKQWDVDIEASWRHGSRFASVRTDDRSKLKIKSGTLHAEVGYTFDTHVRPRIAVDLDFGSGDKAPNDQVFGQYERQFGSRRGDLGATGIFGPLAPANLMAPGAKLDLRPDARSDLRLTWKAVSLASATDSWVVAGVRDSTGRSGKFIGNLSELRARYWLRPGSIRAELGLATLLNGRFAKSAPNASRQGNSSLGYFALTTTF